MQRRKTAFTLVELLVVIGIIALLIAILLPALSKARQASKVVSCLSTLRQLSMAATMFAGEHKSHYPLAGYVNDGTPNGVGDPSMVFYSYYYDKAGTPPGHRINPLPEALAPYLGFHTDTATQGKVTADLANADGVQKLFRCSDDDYFELHIGETAHTGASLTWPTNVYSSYIFNGAILGLTENTNATRLQGNLVAMRGLPNVMFMADGLNRGTKPVGGVKQHKDDNSFEMDNLSPSTVGSVSLADAYAFNNGDCGVMFDLQRHGRKMNVIFMDGHGETFALPKIDPYLGKLPGGSGLSAQSYIGANGYNELNRVKLIN